MDEQSRPSVADLVQVLIDGDCHRETVLASANGEADCGVGCERCGDFGGNLNCEALHTSLSGGELLVRIIKERPSIHLGSSGRWPRERSGPAHVATPAKPPGREGACIRQESPRGNSPVPPNRPEKTGPQP